MIELGPGFPEWTELGQDSGLDPLGMQRPIESIYQSLLPGISTITLRFRYYAFFLGYSKTTKITFAIPIRRYSGSFTVVAKYFSLSFAAAAIKNLALPVRIGRTKSWRNIHSNRSQMRS